MGFEVWVWGLGCGVLDCGWCLGFGVWVWGLVFGVVVVGWDLGLGVFGLRLGIRFLATCERKAKRTVMRNVVLKP